GELSSLEAACGRRQRDRRGHRRSGPQGHLRGSAAASAARVCRGIRSEPPFPVAATEDDGDDLDLDDDLLSRKWLF
ncbi:unnamed protein product, partial [Urochloa humidicola]